MAGGALGVEGVAETRHAARCRRVATRMACSSSASLPSRVPASRATIRARWNRRTLRPASARWSSARTPGDFGTRIRGVSTGASEVSVSAAGSAASTELVARVRLDRDRDELDRRGLRGLAALPPLRAGPAMRRRRLDHAERRAVLGRSICVVRLGLTRLAADHLERALELRAVDRDQLLDLTQHVGQRLQVHLLAVAQLELELREALGDLQADHDLDVVDRHLDDRAVACVVPLAANLAERDEVAQGAIADDLHHRVARDGRRPERRRHRRVRGALELLAPVRRAAIVLALQALERDDLPRPVDRSRPE